MTQKLTQNGHTLIAGVVVLAAIVGIGIVVASNISEDNSSSVSAIAADSYNLDYTTGTLVPPWTEVQAQAPDRAQVVTDPTGQSRSSARFEVRPGDYAGGGNRSEVYYKANGVGTEAVGQESYYAFSTYFPQGFVSPGAWGLFTQFHSDGLGVNPVVAFETKTSTNQVRILIRGGNTKNVQTGNYIISGATTNSTKWQDFILHWKRSTGTDGLVEVWQREEGGTFTKKVTYNGPNMYTDNKGTTKPAYPKQGFYRDPKSTGNTVVYHRGLWKTTSYDAALAYFGSTTPTP